jgi:hypothetical protein
LVPSSDLFLLLEKAGLENVLGNIVLSTSAVMMFKVLTDLEIMELMMTKCLSGEGGEV